MTYRVIRSDRRTLSVQITQEGEVLVRAPRRLPAREIRRFVEGKTPWIETHLQARRAQPVLPPISDAELQVLVDRAKQVIPPRVAELALRIGVDYGTVTIRKQRTRWGSCSAKGNLNFNCLLMLMPQEVIDYVVVHELCHRKELNHSPRFWALVEAAMPSYKTPKQWLKENGGVYICRLNKE